MNKVFASYYCSVSDPQRRKKWPADDFNKIKSIYKSCNRLQIPLVIFHDNCSQQFVDQHTTDFTKFVKVKGIRNSGMECNAFRFLVYRDYLKDHPDIKKVFLVDASDVTIINDPFEIDAPICIGDEPTLIKNARTIMARFNYYFKNEYQYLYNKPLLNAGIIGGPTENVLKLLDAMCEIFLDLTWGSKKKLPKKWTYNMNVLNICAYKLFPDILHGYPLNTRFRMNEHRTDVYFKHK